MQDLLFTISSQSLMSERYHLETKNVPFAVSDDWSFNHKCFPDGRLNKHSRKGFVHMVVCNNGVRITGKLTPQL